MHNALYPKEVPSYARYRPLVAVAVAFVLGILAREWASLPRWGVLSVGVCGVLGWAVLRLCCMPAVALGALYLAVIAAGWLRLDLAVGRMPPHHIARFLSEAPRLVKVRGVVAGEPEVRALAAMPLSGDSRGHAGEARQTRFDLDCVEVEVEGQWRGTCGRLRVVEHGVPQELHYRDEVIAIGVARLPAGPTNPGQLDSATFLRRQGIHATMSVGEGALRVERPGAGLAPRRLLYSARAYIRETLKTRLSADERTAGLLCALVLGDRAGVDEELEGAFARTGTVHLLAVSGFNVAVVAWVVWAVMALAGAGRRMSAAVVMCAVASYAFVTGARPSVVRAAVMAGAIVVGIMGRRQLDPIQSVALAAIALLVLRPYDVFDVGFQLSFVAVLGIMCLSDDFAAVLGPRKSLFARAAVEEEVSLWRRLRSWGWGKAALAAGVSLGAWVAVFPLTAYYFHLFSPITVLVNLAAVPLAAVLTVLGFAHLGVAVVHPGVAGISALPARWTSWLLGRVVLGADSVPLGSQYCSAPALGWVLGYYVLAVVFAARRWLGLSAARAASLWVLGGLAYLLFAASPGLPKGLEVMALDVQHGNATVLRFHDGSTVLYDCGSYGRNDVGRWIVAPALWHRGVRAIDLLVVSHGDADHVNGIPALLDRFKIGHVLHSPVLRQCEAGRQLLDLLRRRGIPCTSVKAGNRIAVGDGNIVEVLWPMDWALRLRPNDQNENSLVIRVEHAGRRVLLAGDIQQVGATVLLRSGLDLRADVLLVPHHGCGLANAGEFAKAVRPAYAICSNRAEHLAPATVAAYEDVGARVLATCWDGAITIEVRRDGIEAKGWATRQAGASRAAALRPPLGARE